MKPYILLILIILVAGCTTSVVEIEDQTNQVPVTNAEDQEPQIPQNNEITPIPPVQNEATSSTSISISSISVIDGGFEGDVENFVALENPLKVGFQYNKYYLGAYEGKGTMRVIVAQAKKEAYETPAFQVSLDGFVQSGKKYEILMYFDDIKGSWAPMKIGFGEKKFSPTSVEIAENKEYTKVFFDVVSDVNSEYLYLYFDGTTAKTFKIDLISISEN